MCEKADVVFIGDYHALPSCQGFATDLLVALAARRRPVVLFLEMIFSRDQRVLDQYLQGTIDAAELRARIHYDRDWGYPWDGYGRLLEAAKRRGIAVVAADAPPRGGLRVIRRRDRHAARKIREALEADPRARAIVLFGESHMARAHLPAELRAELRQHRMKRSTIVVVQNVEEIYWKLAERGHETTDAVRIDGRRLGVFNASPLAKYEAYRQTLLRWAQQEDEAPDFGPSVHHLIDLLVGQLGMDPYRTMAPSAAGAPAALIDLYPEVSARRDRRRRADPRPRRRAMRAGVVYRPAPNRIDVYAFSLGAAGEAASRFLPAALRGRAGRPVGGAPHPSPGEGSRRRGVIRSDAGPPARLPFAMRILDEAFVACAVQYLDPGVAPSARGARSRPANRGPLSAVLDAAAGRFRGRGRAKVTARTRAERMAVIGERLGNGVYAVLRRKPGAGAKIWLSEVARLNAERARSGVKAERLLVQAARWARLGGGN